MEPTTENVTKFAAKFIEPHKQRYDIAFEKAKDAAATTATAGWRDTYTANICEHRQTIDGYAKAIASALENIQHHDAQESDEKDIRDSVKAITDERIRFTAWQHRAVRPFEDSVDRCDMVANTARREAEQQERDQPLIYRGLAGEVDRIISMWPKCWWNSDEGRVDISIIDAETGELISTPA